MLWSEDQCSALCLWSLDSISCMYEFILLMHNVCLVAEKSELVSMHCSVVVVFSTLYIGVCLGCCFIYLVLSYAIVNGVPTAIWAYDDTCEVLLIICSHDYHSFVIFCFTLQVGHPHMSNLAIFPCHCYFAFFPPHVNDNNPGNRYILLNYTIWECAIMITTVLWPFSPGSK
jgi:hypothetical protein